MVGQNSDWHGVSFPIELWPGTGAGSWRVRFGEATTIEFPTALDLLRWLEGLDRSGESSNGGLR